VAERKAHNLEEAFIGYLEEAAGRAAVGAGPAAGTAPTAGTGPPEVPEVSAEPKHSADSQGGFSIGRIWAFARREAVELRHDSVRLAFALLGPLILMTVFGFGISLDVDHLPFAVLDSDDTPASRFYTDGFRGSKYFEEALPITTYEELDRRLRDGELRLAIEIPSGFERDLQRGRAPEIGAFLDAAVPFRAETARGYVEAVHDRYISLLRKSKGLPPVPMPVKFEARALFNQAFKSIYALVPADIMLLLILIPSMLTALSVVREKELGSIANFYATPATKFEFLIGKQLPYFGVALIQFVLLVALAIFLFRVPLKGSWGALAAGGIIYVLASTGFGLLISVFASTQTAAIFAAAIITILPAVQFSGMFVPVSSLKGGAWVAAQIFPSTYFQAISVGTFTKALGFRTLWFDTAALVGLAALYFAISVALLRKQED
ncbi:MAG TPA: ABC transporter permease, partial [Candidatus Binataceae bacterium]|nr:ABC transporter permease [Candidatus Binataceae bacterium]